MGASGETFSRTSSLAQQGKNAVRREHSHKEGGEEARPHTACEVVLETGCDRRDC